jgi:hypothetical protein
MNREPTAIARSLRLMEDLQGSDASIALMDLFHVHGRRAFRVSLDDISHLSDWSGRGARQRLALAISTLHAKGYIRWLPGDKYRIVSRDILTDIEYEEAYPGMTRDGGISRPAEGQNLPHLSEADAPKI